MTPLVFWYAHDQGGDHVASSPDEIDAALDHVATLADTYGAVATITRRGDDVTTLYVGLHGEVGVLYYTDAEAGHYSQGDTTNEDDVLSYTLQQNEMELPPDSELPVSDVRAAVHEYARTGTRPTGIRWQQWTAPDTPGSAVVDPLDPDVWG